MYSMIPKELRSDFDGNVTIDELNNALVKLHIPTIAFIAILMCIGVFGNIIVLILYTNYTNSTYKIFITWLGWMDLLACLVGKPALIISMLYPYLSPSESLCRWTRFLHVFVSVSAALIFLAISYERYKKICFMVTHHFSYKRVNLICLLAAISSVVVAMPSLFVFGNADVDTGVQNITGVECFIDQKYKTSHLPKLYFLFQLLLCLISFFTMCVFYIRIGRTLKWHRSFVNEHTLTSNANIGEDIQLNGGSNSRRTSRGFLMLSLNKDKRNFEGEKGETTKCTVTSAVEKTDNEKSDQSFHRTQRLLSVQLNEKYVQAQNAHTKAITKMLFIVTVVFILAFLPHLILMLMNAIQPQLLNELSPAGVVAYTFFLRTFVINNMANPVVYFVCLGSFRSKCAEKFSQICCFFKGDKRES